MGGTMSSITINGDTSGSVILQAPSVAGSTTLTLPTTTGTLVTSNAMPTGSVLQVVQGSTSTSVSTTNTTATDTGLSASITPSSASNKILIIVTQNYYIQGGATNSGSILLLRGSTTIGTTGDYPIWVTASANIGGIYTINYLDSPSTTSSVTYKTRQKLRDGNEMVTQRDSLTASTITLMEIKG